MYKDLAEKSQVWSCKRYVSGIRYRASMTKVQNGESRVFEIIQKLNHQIEILGQHKQQSNSHSSFITICLFINLSTDLSINLLDLSIYFSSPTFLHLSKLSIYVEYPKSLAYDFIYMVSFFKILFLFHIFFSLYFLFFYISFFFFISILLFCIFFT